ncbi:hypothetical protein [uncultured Clostridium sp.]|uniref:hypothetical protein n=1 Tax=uncultured Clostridium sp. TaxID=59620 RepID=UPI0025FFB7B0|nr:hypothetical protein [uncultured Clostridium sp.]
MEKSIERMNELIQKKTKLSNSHSIEAAEIIFNLYKSDNNLESSIENLYHFHYSVIGIYVNRYYDDFNIQEKENFIKAFVENSKFKENIANSSILKGFSILQEMLKLNENDKNIYYLFNNISSVAEKKGQYNSSVKGAFYEFLSEVGDEFLNLNFDIMSEQERKRMLRYIDATIENSSNISCEQSMLRLGEKYSYKFTNKIDNESIKEENRKDEEDNTEYKNDLQKSYASNELINLVSLLENANEEANKLFKNIFERNLTIKSLEQQITLKEREINEVKLQIRNEKDKSTYLTTKIEELKAELNSSNLEIDNLKGRLKIAFNIDDVKKNQEIITLKTDISTALKLQYEDFNEHKEEECNEDNYEALKVTLNQVFRTLKRYGIDF